MNLEQRVTMLEEEVQLLKNQIQTTLLAIQEQILSNTYPSLRTDDGEVAQMAHAPETPAPEQSSRTTEGLRGVNRVSLDSPDQPNPEPPINKPSVAPPPPPQAPPAPSTPPASFNFEPSGGTRRPSTIDWASLNKMDEWICRKIDKMGVQRTRRLIEFYAETKRFSESVTDTLFQLITLYEEDVDPAAEARHHNQPLSLDDTITSFDPPIRTYYAEAEMSPVRENREVSVRRPSEPEFEFNGNSPSSRNGHVEPEQPDAPRKMILKLIAGLQNAGMDWKKPNG